MIRLQVNLPEEREEELEALMDLTNIATRKELFNTALTLFEWAVKESYFDRIIASMKRGSGNYKELAMPSLDAARRAGRANGVRDKDADFITVPFIEPAVQHQEEELEEESVAAAEEDGSKKRVPAPSI